MPKDSKDWIHALYTYMSPKKQQRLNPCFVHIYMSKDSKDWIHASHTYVQRQQRLNWMVQWFERWTRDRKVQGSSTGRSGGRIFFFTVHCLCWLLFPYPFHTSVTAVARKRAQSFCQKFRWQVTAKHAYTLRDVVHGCMVYTERAETAAVSTPPPCNIQTAL